MKPLRVGRVVASVTINSIMKILRPTLLPLAGLTLFLSPLLRAEDPAGPPPPGERHERREEMRDNAKQMAKDLNLTADQQIQVEAIHKQTAESLKALHKDTSLTDDQRRTKGRELRKSTEEQVDAILTPEQRVKAKELRAKRGRHGPGDRPPGEAPPAK